MLLKNSFSKKMFTVYFTTGSDSNCVVSTPLLNISVLSEFHRLWFTAQPNTAVSEASLLPADAAVLYYN